MNESDITLVQESFAKVVPIKDAAADIFYGDLFTRAPHVVPYFAKADMAEQGSKLMATLAVVVNGLRDLDRIVPVAQELARRHVAYGVTAADYTPVGEALIHTLDTGLGEAFTGEVRAAWTRAYTTLSGVMIDAAYGTTEG